MKKAALYKKERDKVRCLVCAHKCLIDEGSVGICGVRKNIKGELFLLVYGRVVSMNADPIEKKPLFCFLPGSKAFSIGTIGCNFKCGFCQNFEISQLSEIAGHEMSPEEIVERALKTGCKSIAYTYNEPAIFIEFVKDTAILAKKKGLKNILVTNGYLSEECFDFISEYIDAMNIDLKSFSDSFYRKICKARLQPVLDTIARAYKKGIHIELTTLLIPGENDSDEELRKIAEFIARVDKNIPWHISRFFPMYKMAGKKATPLESLRKAEKIGKEAGLRYVYVGNI